ncbi:MAG: hypothetical protein R2862_00705 [Thermoanaerobaculia bacterium]
MNARRLLLAGVLAGAACGLLAAPAAARIVGGNVTTRTAADPAAAINTTARAEGRRWIAWRIEPREENLVGCFRNWRADSPADCRCSLAEPGGNWGSNGDVRSAAAPGRLEIYAAVDHGLGSGSCCSPRKAHGRRRERSP